MTRAMFFKHFELLADQQDAVAKMRELVWHWAAQPQIRRSVMFIAHASQKTPKLRRSGIDAARWHHFELMNPQMITTKDHAAPLGLGVGWGASCYKQAAPTELLKRYRL